MNRLGASGAMSRSWPLQEGTSDSKAPAMHESQVRPGLRVSLQGVMKFLLFMAAATRAGAQSTPAQPAPEPPQPLAPLTLVDVMSMACAEGACSALIGASATSILFPAECPIVADTLEGLGTRDSKTGDREVMFFQPSESQSEHSFASGAELLRAQPWVQVCGTQSLARRVEQVLSTQSNLTARFVNLLDRTNPNLPLQPGGPDSAVVGMTGIMFALGRQKTLRTIDSPWKPTTSLKFNTDVPVGSLADDLLHRMQIRSPTMFVTDGAIFVPGRVGGSVDRDVVLRHFLSKGYFVAETGLKEGEDSWRALVFLPPTPEISKTFEAYAREPMNGLSVQSPTDGAIRGFHKDYPRVHDTPGDKEHPRGHDWPDIVVTTFALASGVALVLTAQARKDPTQVAPQDPSLPEQPPARPVPRQRRSEVPHRPDTKYHSQPLAGPLAPAATFPPHSAGEIYRQALDDLLALRTSHQRGLQAARWGQEAEAALNAGDPVGASAQMRACIDINPESTQVGRMLNHFDVSYSEIVGALEAQIHSGQDVTACRTELTRLKEHEAVVKLAMVQTEDYDGDEKGRQGPALREPKPKSKSTTAPAQDTDTKAPATELRNMSEVRRLAERLVASGHGAAEDGQIYIGGRPEATQRLHVGTDFLSLKLGNSHHIRIFANGGTLRPDSLDKAIDYARHQPHISPDVLDFLLFIQGQGPHAAESSS